MSDNLEMINTLRNTNRCLTEIQQMAENYSAREPEQIENLMRTLIETGEDRALGILLNICAYNRLQLDPELLAQTLKVVEGIMDFNFLFNFQDEKAIKPLLNIAQAPDISWERQAQAARLAAELAVKYNQARQPVRKVLWKLSNEIKLPEISWVIDSALEILDLKDMNEKPFIWFSQSDLLRELPKDKAPVVIGGHYSVRRPVSKISRNAPCPCGSGKKYKKCCYEKDQEILSDASPYEGLTRTQVKSSPSLVQDADLIYEMRAFQLKKLRPSELNDDQLFAAYRHADTFGLHELAFAMLLELKRRPDKEDFAVEHMVDLLESTLNANNITLARKVKQHIPDDKIFFLDAIKFRLSLLEAPERLADLEARCKQALCDPEKEFENIFLELSYNFENLLPALCVVFGRAALASQPDRLFDNDMLIEVIQNARIALDLDPWSDPIEDYYEWTLDKHDLDFEQKTINKELEQLRQQTIDAQKSAAKKTRELNEKEREIENLLKKLSRVEKEHKDSGQNNTDIYMKSAEVEETLKHLRQHVKNLKVEIKSQQQARGQLRKQLQETQKKVLAKENDQISDEPNLEEESPIEFEEVPKKILVPEYTATFKRNCESLPQTNVAKALRAAAGFAAHDKVVLRQTKKIDKIPECFRIRIGLNYRLLLQWQRGESLQILDLIPRGSLETWIKQRLV